MIAVIFEVEPDPARRQEYLDTAGALRAELETVDGFVSVERFASLAQPGKLLSLSFWRDEEAVRRWRACATHRAAQAAGRAGVQRIACCYGAAPLHRLPLAYPLLYTPARRRAHMRAWRNW